MRTDGHRHDAAAVGIGTMIVFIATVLIATIAAGVLIDTSSRLQSQSQSTGEAATEEIATSLRVDSVVGIRNNTGQSDLVYLELYVSPAAGAAELDLTTMRLQVQTSGDLVLLNYSQASSAASGQFIASTLRDADGSFTEDTPVVNKGDLVKLNLTATANGISLSPRTDVSVALIPEVGARSTVDFTTPVSFGQKTIIRMP